LSSRAAWNAIASTDQPAYSVVDVDALGPGNPQCVTDHNMASVRRVATGLSDGQRIVFNKILPAIVHGDVKN
jgi:hypothetical protein